MPIVAVAAAVYAAEHGWGLFNAVPWPAWLEIILAVVILDFAIWPQHLASHKVPLLWRLHRVHHADPEFDLTSGIRFHAIGIGLSMLYTVVWVLALGPAALAVVLFEVILNAGAMFTSRAGPTLRRLIERKVHRLAPTALDAVCEAWHHDGLRRPRHVARRIE